MSAPIVLTIAPVFLLSGGAAVAFIGLAIGADRGRSDAGRRSAASASTARPQARRASAAYRHQPKQAPATTPPLLMLEAAPTVLPVETSDDVRPDADVIDLSEIFADRGKRRDEVAA